MPALLKGAALAAVTAALFATGCATRHLERPRHDRGEARHDSRRSASLGREPRAR
jgi:hypothetical protein